MNLTHVRYAVEVERTGSITRAAENLYMGQPNLSKAIRELETSLGIRLFRRSPSGVEPTARGREFLGQAKKLLVEIDELEGRYTPGAARTEQRMAAPCSAYISRAFAQFAASCAAAPERMAYIRASAQDTVTGIADGEYDIGIVSFETRAESDILRQINERGLRSRMLFEYDCRAVMGAAHPLAGAELPQLERFAPYPLIDCGGPRALRDDPLRRITVRDLMCQYELISGTSGAYTLCAPVPPDMLRRFNLVEKRISDAPRMRDIIVTDGHTLSEAGAAFVDILFALCSEFDPD